MTRFGNFFNFLATNFLTKVAQIFNDFLGYFENIKFYVKIAVPTFLGNYVKIWASFYSNIWSHCISRHEYPPITTTPVVDVLNTLWS